MYKPSPRVRSSVIPGRDLNYTSHVAPPTLGKGIRTKPVNGTVSLTNRSLNGSLINKTVDSAIETSLTGGANRPPSSGRLHDPDELPPANEEVVAVENNGVYSPETDPRAAALQRVEARQARGDVPRLRLDGSACDDSLILNKSPAPTSTTKTATTSTTPASSETNLPSPRVVTSVNSKPIVRLNSPDYFTEPTINAMKEMVSSKKCLRFCYSAVSCSRLSMVKLF
ncbi:unnamed protein product [Cylicostephanus goldi]|uniref:Uncharacterized protein n=1 Tax=Cylicostephanus goldi TaxID=71465 RepID=A0A3P7MKU7_CYLGO|nr:unnamed protein product [Cylicostephanus goldi]